MKKFMILPFLFALLLPLFPLLEIAEEFAELVDLSRSEYVIRDFKVEHTLREERCLTEAIYYEAGNQSEIGKEAVALVIMNRVVQSNRPNTVCGVITQARTVNDRKICQFSFWCETKYKPNKVRWEESRNIARRSLTNYWKRDIISQYETATYFHADYVKPKWHKHKEYLGKIDNHLFYGDKH